MSHTLTISQLRCDIVTSKANLSEFLQKTAEKLAK